MATTMGRSGSDVIEVALDRMYREEVRFDRIIHEGDPAKNQCRVDPEKRENDRNND